MPAMPRFRRHEEREHTPLNAEQFLVALLDELLALFQLCEVVSRDVEHVLAHFAPPCLRLICGDLVLSPPLGCPAVLDEHFLCHLATVARLSDCYKRASERVDFCLIDSICLFHSVLLACRLYIDTMHSVRHSDILGTCGSRIAQGQF